MAYVQMQTDETHRGALRMRGVRQKIKLLVCIIYKLDIIMCRYDYLLESASCELVILMLLSWTSLFQFFVVLFLLMLLNCKSL